MISKLDNALSFQQQALGLRAYRQQLLAANIANADTPHYKARDVDFASALKEASAGRSAQSLALSTSSPRHLASRPAAGPAPLLYRGAAQGSVDGNSVDMDVERAQFADNALRYEAGITFLSSQIRTLTAAIQG